METCDVLIVGGGPAGSSCAWGLRDAGLDVRVIDRKPFPRDKVCAGWVTPQVIAALQLDLADYARTYVCQPIIGFRTGLIGGREVENLYDHPVSYGIRRCEFDHYLRERAPARHETWSIESLEHSVEGWTVNGSLRTKLLIGAGGHFCPVARLLGARTSNARLVVAAQEIEFAATPEQLAAGSVEAALPELYFCPDLAGYGWCFRKGPFLNIGLGRTDREQLGAHVEAFVTFLRDRGKIAGDLDGRFHGHAYQLYERTVPKLIDEHVMLIGDAAGLAYPQSGEGIRPAVESGLLAARTIHNAAGRYERASLQPYSDALTSRLGTPRTTAASDWLPASWLQFVAARLMASRRFTRRVVIENWFLHMHEPALRSEPAATSAV
jgi:flavin-dependent dehydrogenase